MFSLRSLRLFKNIPVTIRKPTLKRFATSYIEELKAKLRLSKNKQEGLKKIANMEVKQKEMKLNKTKTPKMFKEEVVPSIK